MPLYLESTDGESSILAHMYLQDGHNLIEGKTYNWSDIVKHKNNTLSQIIDALPKGASKRASKRWKLIMY